MPFDIPRERLRQMGVPEDMTADDVVALFSLPDDDDTMHQGDRRKRESMSKVYRVLPWSNHFGGYVVYRHVFDEAKCSAEDGAAAHKVAVFVEEGAAKDYCDYRNGLIDLNGSDELPPAQRL